ncbi:hypothetical protein E4U60_007041 [Claviceps pazoutovae]|uniref:Uncharacterized protein n=1 Tax=Claviceps pazoutovae TaxID=1649127 RepID=A0A9P7MF50_9HYPO|nr:hypothetical protein E4U60_007041 [Claviceps pazoutovae]
MVCQESRLNTPLERAGPRITHTSFSPAVRALHPRSIHQGPTGSVAGESAGGRHAETQAKQGLAQQREREQQRARACVGILWNPQSHGVVDREAGEGFTATMINGHGRWDDDGRRWTTMDDDGSWMMMMIDE